MRFLTLLFCLFFFVGFSQTYSKKEKALLIQVSKLDSLMENNNSKILELFSDDVSFGHSNGWIQNKADFKKDFESGKVKYQSVKQTELKEFKIKNKFANIRRIIAVKGLYKNETFEMKLSVLEFWIREKGIWKLWSRQSVKIN
ncbi:nuclear transport factor 2 family protein [Epilithonimonas vandammei]|uniref:Nuclear transport factor 2 family protein n=1 Tax=Epilithonimonas vandammei TaxID=2487072 RepID=A0A3G8ZHP7_9FLAO|nr:nuclear transport factor 2 family protein [Epilithonimonas vandammei]AZI53944.1 nuclear transport factor 2 family protein [Epilithonimonas vandammei]